MTRKSLAVVAGSALLWVVGCDPNPTGPSAPSPAPAQPGGAAPAGDQPKTQPLKSAGQPIGMTVPAWIAPDAR